MDSRRIAILFHENETEQTLSRYVVTMFAEWWREDGHEVIYLSGTKEFVPADLLFVHVDLSVVPERFLEFAKLYPVAINDRVSDIRKSIYSTGILTAGDSYDGKVFVKSNYNHGGRPERKLYGEEFPLLFASPQDYLIFDRLNLVPDKYFDPECYLVQKFQPEMDGDMYCVRMLHFLGERMNCLRLKSDVPIVNGRTSKGVDELEPDPDILELRERMGFDYGKFDYVMIDGKAVLLDANKTIGTAGPTTNSPFEKMRRHRAQGLYKYFDTPAVIA